MLYCFLPFPSSPTDKPRCSVCVPPLQTWRGQHLPRIARHMMHWCLCNFKTSTSWKENKLQKYIALDSVSAILQIQFLVAKGDGKMCINLKVVINSNAFRPKDPKIETSLICYSTIESLGIWCVIVQSAYNSLAFKITK